MKQSWFDQKKYLVVLIKKLSDYHYGDDPEWLAAYSREVVESYKHGLQTAIRCFESLIPGEQYGKRRPTKPLASKE